MNATMTVQHAWVIRGLVGWQLGGNALADPSTGEASDGRKGDFRTWLQVIRYF